MDDILGFKGRRVPDGPNFPGRGKVVWETQDLKIVFEQHPYDTGPSWHTGPHWHYDAPGMPPHKRFLPGDKIPDCK
jgi:hypothetical protein